MPRIVGFDHLLASPAAPRDSGRGGQGGASVAEKVMPLTLARAHADSVRTL